LIAHATAGADWNAVDHQGVSPLDIVRRYLTTTQQPREPENVTADLRAAPPADTPLTLGDRCEQGEAVVCWGYDDNLALGRGGSGSLTTRVSDGQRPECLHALRQPTRLRVVLVAAGKYHSV